MPLNETRWRNLISQLRKGNCCLLLGTEINCVSKNNELHTVYESFSDFLVERLTAANIAFDNGIDNFYYLANRFVKQSYPGRPFMFEDDIREFDSGLHTAVPDFYKKLGLLPFRSVLCTTPDRYFSRAVKDMGYAFEEATYDYIKGMGEKKDIDERMQLVFNIFGSFEQPSSITYNERDNVKQIKKLATGGDVIPDNILSRFNNQTKTFIFLGFNFNEWYFRLVMDSMQLPNPVASYHPKSGRGMEVAILSREYYYENFGIEFIEPDTDAFLNELLQRYELIYGDPARSMMLVLDFQENDRAYYRGLRDQLNNSFNRRIALGKATIQSKDDLPPAAPLTDMDVMAAQADIYIAFLSADFLGDPASLQRLRTSLGKDTQHTIVITANYVAYETVLGDIKEKAIVLPKDNVVLSYLPTQELNKTYFQLSTLINSLAR